MASNQMVTQQDQELSINQLVGKASVQKKLHDMLGKKAAGFASSIISLAQSDNLKDCNPESILKSAMIAATMDLPINPNFGMAYVVPYNDKKKGKIAQFQMGYKGFIQLALRSGQFKYFNADIVYEGELKSRNKLTGSIEFEEDTNLIDYSKPVGYFAYFQLLNGFEKTVYMTVEEAESHGKRYSQSYKSTNDWVRNSSLWSTDFDGMAIKTVVKNLLSKYAPLSIEMQTALENDNTYDDGNGNRSEALTSQQEQREMTASKEFVDADYVEESVSTQSVRQQQESNECPI